VSVLLIPWPDYKSRPFACPSCGDAAKLRPQNSLGRSISVARFSEIEERYPQANSFRSASACKSDSPNPRPRRKYKRINFPNLYAREDWSIRERRFRLKENRLDRATGFASSALPAFARRIRLLFRFNMPPNKSFASVNTNDSR